jgi:Arc/MetJ-type ribon-helix-helix transcriptional regulator
VPRESQRSVSLRAGLYARVEEFVQKDPCAFPSVGFVVDYALRKLMEDHQQHHREEREGEWEARQAQPKLDSPKRPRGHA